MQCSGWAKDWTRKPVPSAPTRPWPESGADTHWSARAPGHDRRGCWLMLSFPSESKPAALLAVPDLKRLDLGHCWAAQGQAEVVGEPAKSGLSLMAIFFLRQGCSLLANQLKLPLEEGTSGLKQDGLHHPSEVSRFYPKVYARSVFQMVTTNLLEQVKTWAYIPLILLPCKVPTGKYHRC